MKEILSFVVGKKSYRHEWIDRTRASWDAVAMIHLFGFVLSGVDAFWNSLSFITPRDVINQHRS